MGSIFLLLSALSAGIGGGLFCRGYVSYRQQQAQHYIVYRLALAWIAYLAGLYLALLSGDFFHMWDIVTIKLVCVASMGVIMLVANALMKDSYGEDFMLSKYWVAFFFLIYTLVVLGVDNYPGLRI